MTPAESIATAYEALARRAWDTNRARAAELTSLIAEWSRTGGFTAEQRAHAGALAHGLRGSAGTFGHDEASTAAEDLETLLSGPEQDGQVGLVAIVMARIDAALASVPVLEH